MFKIIIAIVIIIVILLFVIRQKKQKNLVKSQDRSDDAKINKAIENQRKDNKEEIERLKKQLLDLKLQEEKVDSDSTKPNNNLNETTLNNEDESETLEQERLRLREELRISIENEHNEDIEKLEKLYKNGYFENEKIYYLVKGLVETEYIKRPRILRSWSFDELIRLHEFNDMQFKIEMTVDFHRLNKDSAYYFLNKIVKYSKGRLVVLTIIHGFNHGTVLREMVWKDFKNIKIQDKHLHNNNVGRTTLLIEP